MNGMRTLNLKWPEVAALSSVMSAVDVQILSVLSQNVPSNQQKTF